MPPFDTTETLAAAIAAALPPDAVAFRDADGEGRAWRSRLAARTGIDMPVYIGLCPSGTPRAGVARWPEGGTPGAGGTHAHLLPILKDLGLAGSGNPARTPQADPPPGASEFARRVASALDVEAVRTLVRANATDVEAYAWLAEGGPERARRHALAAAYPWAVDAALEAGAEIWDDTEEDVACDLLRSGDVAGCGPEGTLRHVVRRIRGMGFEGFDRRDLAGDLRSLTFLPKAWIPEGRDDMTALAALAPHLVAFATASGHPLNHAMRPSGGWASALSRAAARAGCPGRPPREAAASAARLVADMTESFHRQVVWPAAIRVDPALAAAPPRPPSDGANPRAGRTPLQVAAHRVLLGDTGFAGAVEAASRWVSAHTRIAGAVAGLAAARDVSWPVAFEAVRDRLGVVVACVADAGDMLDEAAELDHCVCSYLPRCLSGESAIASVRQVGPDGRVRERLSTMELRPGADGRLRPVQHVGLGNGPPPDVAALAAGRFAALLAAAPPRPAPEGGRADANATLLALYGDGYDAMAEAWSPLLRPAARGLAPQALLALGGFEPAGPSGTFAGRR